MKVIQRMVPLSAGKRTGLKLDRATWEAVDWLVARRGVSWQEWCRSIIESAPAGDNTTGTIRAAAMDELLSATVFAERDEQLELMTKHPLMRDSGVLNDEQFTDIMKTATVLGSTDFGGFSVGFGQDDASQDCIWIRNGLRDGLHFAFTLPHKARK